MSPGHQVTNLEQLLERIREAAAKEDPVSLGDIFEMVGHRSFGPLLLLAGLVTLAPLVGDVPGVPTLMALLVMLTAGQVLLRHEHLWLPGWLLRRSVNRGKLCRALDWMSRPARFIDRFLRPRLTALTHRAGVYAVAVACVLVAAAMPIAELVPFSANGVGVVLTSFGLALIAHDGLLVLIAFAVLTATTGAVAYYFL